MREEVLRLGPHRALVGVLTPAAQKRSLDDETVVILLNAGLVHHVGPHRLHVKLARALAASGLSVLRLDFSGIGDSPVRPDDLPAREIPVREVAEVVDDLSSRGFSRFNLFGICSGAKNALRAAANDPRITGLVLVNPASSNEDFETASHATIQYYLRRSIWRPRAWWNLITGRVNYSMLFQSIGGEVKRQVFGRSAGSASIAKIAQRDLEPALHQGARALLVLSDRHAGFADLLLDCFGDLLQSGQLRIAIHEDADHLFTPTRAQNILIDDVCDWLNSQPRLPKASG